MLKPIEQMNVVELLTEATFCESRIATGNGGNYASISATQTYDERLKAIADRLVSIDQDGWL